MSNYYQRRTYPSYRSVKDESLTGEKEDTRNKVQRNPEWNSSYKSSGNGRNVESDSRISTNARLLSHAVTEDDFAKACNQIESLLGSLENRKYITKSFSFLQDPFLDGFKWIQRATWKGSGIATYGKLLGVIFNSMGSQSRVVCKWINGCIFDAAAHEKYSLAFVIRDVVLTAMDGMKPDQISTLLKSIHGHIDSISEPLLFKLFSTIFSTGILKNEPSTSEFSMFQDFTDILIGWMTDGYEDELGDTYFHLYAIVQDLKPLFSRDHEFLGDLISSTIDFVKDAAEDRPINSVRIIRLLKTLESLLALKVQLNKDFLKNNLERLVATVNDIMCMESDSENHYQKSREFVHFTNECLSLTPVVDGVSIQSFLTSQLQIFKSSEGKIEHWNSEVVIAFLGTLNVWVETVGAQNQIPPNVQEICAEIMSFVDQARPWLTQCDQVHILRLIHSLLRTRNVNLLLKVYHWILARLQLELFQDENHSNSSEVRKIGADLEEQSLVLASIADIATNKSGSILSLRALEPSIIEILMLISVESLYEAGRNSALEILKSHCIAHSHFASSITSSKIYEADSPSSRFLNSLMNFWKLNLRGKDLRRLTWIFRWIVFFFKSTVPFAPALIETHLECYLEILKKFASLSFFRDMFGDFLQWIAQDPNYAQSAPIQDLIREICLQTLLAENQPDSVYATYSEVLKLLPAVIILPNHFNNSSQLVTDSNNEEWKDDEVNGSLIANAEMNSFLKNLLIYGKSDQDLSSLSIPSKGMIKAAVDFVIRSKLKTTLGRAQEFFSQLQHMVRKIIRRGVSPSFQWKLDFLYQLQQKILLCIYESAFLASDIPESIRTFYVTNKIPCTGWLKRMGPECIEVSLALKNYAMAYFFSVSIGDDQKGKLALLQLQDEDGLKGMNEMSGYFYLKCEYEKAEHLAKASHEDGADPVSDFVLERTKCIFSQSVAKLATWTQPYKAHSLERSTDLSADELMVFSPPLPSHSPSFKLPVESAVTLLNLQLEHYGSRTGVKVLGGVEDFSNLKLYEMVQMEGFILNSRNFSVEEKRQVQSLKLEEMIRCGNLREARNWITQSRWCDASQLDLNLERKVNTFRILGDLLYKEGNHFESGTMYSSILELLEEDYNVRAFTGEPSPIAAEIKAEFYLAFAKKVKDSDTFFERAVTKSTFLGALEGRLQTQQLFYDRARESSRNSSSQVRANAWFDYATFAFDRSLESGLTPILTEVLVSNALHSYANYIKWNQKKKISEGQRGKMMMAMIRLIKLYRENHRFIPEDLITNSCWLKVLPELVKLPSLQLFLISKFPEEASFLVASLQYMRGKKQFFNRRGIFDPATFFFTEASEDPIQLIATKNTQNPGQLQLNTGFKGENEDETELTSKLNSYFIIVREIERIGTTKEELWMEVIQRISSDWVKRVNTLRKDLARDHGGSPEKVKAYVRPVCAFLKGIWKLTMEGDTPADVAFICRYSEKITGIIKSLEDCSTADTFASIYETLLHYASIFESCTSWKLSLLNVSPTLARFNFLGSDNPVTLPGLENGVTISSAHPTINCLHTKTNPKRISFRGSNGQIYEYLVKGNENLHIDAGIMQLLRVVEEFSACPTRHYCVTPIGERGGLIQIVRNAVPLFLMYKKYLQRNNLAERPSEMFWRRLESLGFKDRSDVKGLKEVYNSLKQETPSDLISRDLLLCSENTTDWYKAVQTFTRDVAMGSAMGYIVGLADRHLDNILINLRQGHLVHVDFSILFGKGAQLKIPERVPFRLTQNILEALQYPGVQGAFTVYLDKLLQKFAEGKEMAVFCIQNIARDSLLEARPQVSPEIILQAELLSTLELIRLRIKNIWRIMEILIGEIKGCALQVKGTNSVWLLNSPKVAIERLKKKLYRWRRLLANLDPLIQFAVNHSSPSAPLAGFHNLVHMKWDPLVMDFWSRMDMDVLLQSSSLFDEKFRLTEETLEACLREIPQTFGSEIAIKPGSIVNSGEERVDDETLRSIMDSVQERLSSFIPLETATGLITKAMDEENLALMFEGWIAWV